MQDTGTVEDINMERLHAIVHGDVQGVGFRYFVQRKAQQIGLSGWVRNNDDGTVELVAEGTRTQLEDLRRVLEDGPSLARVDRVETKWSEGTGNLGRFELAW
jgi:acylphosphatase